MVDPQIATTFQQYLRPGEHLAWTGRPAGGPILRGRDLFLIPFSILWLSFVVFWEWSVVRSGGSLYFQLFGAAFLCIGLFFVVGRFVVDALARQGTVYALSNERAFVLRRFFGERLLTTRLNGAVRLKDRRDEVGTIEFGAPTDPLAMMRSMSMWTPSLSDEIRFERIRDVMAAYRVAQQAKEA